MKKYKTSLEKVQRLKSAQCNKCEVSLFAEGIGYYGHEFSVDNGFGDIDDLMNHSFDLCDVCYNRIIKFFKIPVTRKKEII